MKQLFIWGMAAVFALWALRSAYTLASGWAFVVQQNGPFADRKNVAWHESATENMMFVVFGLVSAVGLSMWAVSDRWEQRLRESCHCGVLECHCTIDADLLHR